MGESGDLPGVEELYAEASILNNAKDKIAEYENNYLKILKASKGNNKEKRLAAMSIVRFFKNFPDLLENTIDSQLDLCEDEDVEIRKLAIKGLPQFCKENATVLPRIADVLAQLLQTDDQSEIQIVQQSLVSLFRIDAKGTIVGLFSQIENGEDLIRTRTMQFLSEKLEHIPSSIFTKDLEDMVIAKCKIAIKSASGDEFLYIVKMLSRFDSMSTLIGRQSLMDMILDQACINSSFEATDSDSFGRLLHCGQEAVKLSSKNLPCTKFVNYICTSVIDQLDSLPISCEHLEVYRLLADMTEHFGAVTEEAFNKLFSLFITFAPLPPDDPEDAAKELANPEPNLDFSKVECLLYILHKFGSKTPSFFTDNNAIDQDRFDKFRVRLQFLARGVQHYIKQLRDNLRDKKPSELKSDENTVKVIALKVTDNINKLVRDFLHNPPSYKTQISLSWKQPTPEKRKSLSETSSKPTKQVYQPPSSGRVGGRGSGEFAYNRGRNRGSGFSRRW